VRCHRREAHSFGNVPGMTALVELAHPVARRRVVVCLTLSRQLIDTCEALIPASTGDHSL